MIDTSLVKAVIFDYDGVIADSDPFSQYAFGETLRQKGIVYTDEIYKKYFAGRKLTDSLRLLLEPLGRLAEIDDFISLKKSFDTVYASHLKGYPDAIALIRTLKPKYRLAIATGSRRTLLDTAFRTLRLEHTFEVVVCAEEYLHGKPDPEVYSTTLQKLNLSPKEAVVIEDTPQGVAASRAAGIPCIAVTHTHSASELQGAELIVDTLLESTL